MGLLATGIKYCLSTAYVTVTLFVDGHDRVELIHWGELPSRFICTIILRLLVSVVETQELEALEDSAAW